MTPTLRALTRSRAFSLTAVLTLGLGLALCLIVAAVAHAYLFRSMPYPDADRLYSVQYAPPGERSPQGLNDVDWASLGDLVEHPIAWDLDMFYLLGGAYPESAPGAWVTPGYVAAFGVRAALGRDLTAADFEPGRPMVALISHRLWQTRFGGDPAIVGQRLNVYVSDRPDEPESIEVVGVTRADFWHVNPYTDVIAPLRATAYPYMLQLRAGAPASLVETRVTTLVRGGAAGATARPVSLVPFQAAYTATVRPVVWALAAAAALVLIIACANVAVLLLVRAQRREREVALRVALGASRGRVIAMLLGEALWLGAAASAVGVAAAAVAIRWLAPVVEGVLDRRVPGGAASLGLDPWLVGGAMLIGLASTLAFSLAPAIGAWRRSLAPAVTSGARATSGGARTRSLFIGLEVAVSLTLLTGALLMMTSAQRMLAVDFGIRADAVTTAGLSLRQQSYPDPADRAVVFERLLDRLSQATGGGTIAIGDWWPLQAPPPRQFSAAPDELVDGGILGVTPGYFAALGIPLRDGRAFTGADRLGGEPVAIVSDSLARRLWPSSSAVGQTMRITAPPAQGETPVTTPHRVVGVVANVRQTHADANLLDAYVPLLQGAGRFVFAYFPVAAPSPTWERDVRAAVAEIDAQIAVGVPRRLQSALDQERLRPRALAWLLSTLAAFAVVLALVGIYGVVAYAARQREREVAVRMAIGADRAAVTTLFVRQGATVLAGGLIAGLAGAWGMGRVLSAQLFGVGQAEPWILALGAALLGAGGLAAVWWPARRAAGADPAAILKAE